MILVNRVKNRIFRDFRKLIDGFKYYYGYDAQVKTASCSLYDTLVVDKEFYFGKEINLVKKFYLSHRFDLLGSGWVENSYKAQSIGCIGFRYDEPFSTRVTKPSQIVAFTHKNRAKKIESIISHDYKFIDWQRDIKSGYRWNIRRPYFSANKVIGKLEGVDIKVPWEMSRLQHLPQLAFFVLNESLEEQEKAKVEFCDVSLDFFASNPTGMGVNWACTMDVAIRASNLIVAKSLFSVLGTSNRFSDEFEEFFTQNVHQHGEFIFKHLEYNSIYPKRNNNHYLSNISGLVFCGAYFPEDTFAKKWLDFAKDELLVCLDNQFHDDGSNFEASTSYHRLSGELTVYPIAVLLKLYGESWVSNYLGTERLVKLFKIGRFTKSITKPDGTIPQIGDNDSGRYFKIDLCGELLTNIDAVNKYHNLEGYLDKYSDEEKYWDQNCLDHSSFVNVVESLFGIGALDSLESKLLMFLSDGNKLKLPDIQTETVPFSLSLSQCVNNEREFASELIYKSDFPLNDLKTSHFFNFGLTILTCDNHFYCSIYSGGVGQAGNGGHAHADFGSYDLVVNGKDIAKDPGTFLYTPSEKWRDKFRKNLHNGFVKDSYIFRSPFSASFLSSQVFVGEQNILLKSDYSYREISVDGDLFRVSTDKDIICENEYFSPGYGKLITNAI
jgi:hypothetical protein